MGGSQMLRGLTTVRFHTTDLAIMNNPHYLEVLGSTRKA